MTSTTAYERLETGWWPETPSGDTVLRSALLAMAASCEELARAAGGRTVRRGSDSQALSGSACAFLNVVVPLAPPESWDALAVPPDDLPVTLWSAWPTPDLRTRRWELVGHPPLMYRPAGPRVTAPSRTVPDQPGALDLRGGNDPAGLEVVTVRDPATLDAVSRTLVAGYPVDALADTPDFFPSGLLESTGWRFWLGRAGGAPVAASAAYVTEDVTLVAWVATLPGARGRGYGEALTWRAVLAAPDRPAVLLTSDAGRSVYARMGFTSLLRFTLWEHAAGRAPRQMPPG